MNVMTDIKRLLQEADPLRTEETLSPGDAQVLRTAMLEEAATAPKSLASAWHRPLALAAIVIVMIGISGATGDRALKPFSSTSSGTVSPSARSEGDRPVDAQRTQIQFATPGGTRVIWVLDPNPPLAEPMP